MGRPHFLSVFFFFSHFTPRYLSAWNILALEALETVGRGVMFVFDWRTNRLKLFSVEYEASRGLIANLVTSENPMQQ